MTPDLGRRLDGWKSRQVTSQRDLVVGVLLTALAVAALLYPLATDRSRTGLFSGLAFAGVCLAFALVSFWAAKSGPAAPARPREPGSGA